MPDKWIIRKDVPILDEHTIESDDGKPLVELDEQHLQHIAKRNNRRITETGDWIPIVVGHTKGEPGDYVPEEQQPEIVGYAGHLKVKNFKRTGRKAIHATFKFFKDKVDKIRKFPRRSIELWLNDWKIDPISLLGATTPERDLGLLQLSEGGRKVYRRVLKFEKSEKPPMEQESLVKAVLDAIKQTDVWQFMEKLMQDAEEEEPGDELPPGEGDELPPEGEDDLPPGDELDEEDANPPDAGQEVNPQQEEGNEPVRYSHMGSGCSTPSGSNTYTQGDFSGNGMKKKSSLSLPKKPGRQQYSRRPVGRVTVPASDPREPAGVRDLRVQLSRTQRANAGLQTAFNELRLKFQRSEREKDLMALESQGVELDREEELEWLAGLDDEEYQLQLGRIRKRYAKAPIGGNLGLESARTGNPVARLSGRDRDQAMQVANYASRKGITYEDALAELEGE